MGSRIRGVLFDIDDTLFDRRRAQDLALEMILGEWPDLFAGVDLGRARWVFFESDRITYEEYEVGTTGEAVRARRGELFLRMLDLDTSLAREIADLYIVRYPTVDAPVPGARALLRNLAPRFRLGGVSSGWPDVQYRKLEGLGIRERFACVVLSEEVGIEKPDPGIFRHAASLLALSPEECAYVGDLFDKDVAGARDAGLLACWYNPLGERCPAGEVGPGVVAGELGELVPVLGRLGAPNGASRPGRGEPDGPD